MLDSINLNNKSFEQIRDEAAAQIPLYSKDWTNYNVSDPGITILENFAAFLALQQGELNEVPDWVSAPSERFPVFSFITLGHWGGGNGV